MAGTTIQHGASPKLEQPADIWATNRGIYLGLTPVGRTDQERPLAGKDREISLGREYPIRSTWEPDGKANLFVGEGHIALFGPQGSGKTRKILMTNLFKLRDWSALVIDTKGGLCAHTAMWRAERAGHRVFVIDPFEVMKTNYPHLYRLRPDLFKSCGFNPMAVPSRGKDHAIDEAKALAMALIQTDASRDPYWTMAAQALTKGVAMALGVDRPGQSDNLNQLRGMLSMTAEELATTIDYLVRQHGDNWPAIRSSLNEFRNFKPEDREIGGIRRTAIAQTDWLDSPLIQRDLSITKNVFDFASLKTAPATVYLILPPEQLVSHGVWLRLMVTAALRPLLRSIERSPVPVLFMLDEFAALGRMSFIEDNMAQMREFGVKLLTVWQHLPQMLRLYQDGWEAFMATADIKMTFTANDANTREYFSRLSGERMFTHYMHSSSQSISSGFGLGNGNLAGNMLHNLTNQNNSNSESWNQQYQTERVIKPHELAALDADEAVIFGRRGKIHRAICPQPEQIIGIQDAMREVRAIIDGKKSRLLA